MTDDRSPDLLHIGALHSWRARHGGSPLTDPEATRFLLGRVEAWNDIPRHECPCGLLEFLGMSPEEFGSWQSTHVVPARVRRIWDLGAPQVPGPGPAREQAAVVVPKVTADPRTAALYALTQGDRTRAREAIGQLGTTERRAYLTQLTELINMLWGELG